jgi:hypothetical protein
MKCFLFITVGLISSIAFAASNFGIDMNVEKVVYNKPKNKIGKAGSLVFKSAKIYNDGITMDINNLNNMFNSQLFIRPNFLGFTTQFGNFGYAIDGNSALKEINQSALDNSQISMDDYQMNFSGENFLIGTDKIKLRMQKYRIYCQGTPASNLVDETTEVKASGSFDIVKNCLNFSTINGAYNNTNQVADVDFESFESKAQMKFKMKKVELRSKTLKIDFDKANIISNNSYFINTDSLQIECEKEKDMTDFDFDRIYNSCTNKMKVVTQNVSMIDKAEGTSFNLSLNKFQVANNVAEIGLNSATISDSKSRTTLNNVAGKCKKNRESDLLEIGLVLSDCLSEGQLSIQSIASSTIVENDSSADAKNITITSQGGKLNIQSQIHFLGMDHTISISGNASMNKETKVLSVVVSEAKLPFRLSSVKILMIFLKKYMVSKDIQINDRTISIAL